MKTKMRVLLLSTAGILLVMLLVMIWQQPKETAVPVQGSIARTQDIYNSVYAPGEIEAVDSRDYTVAHAALVNKVYVKAGDKVQAGQVLAEITESTVALPDDAVQTFAEGVQQGEVADSSAVANALRDVSEHLENTYTVTAEQSGTVLRAPDAGETLLPGLTYLKIADTSRLRVRAQIPEAYIRQVAEGQSANVTCDAEPDRTVAARVSAVAPYARRAASLTGQTQAATVEAVLSLIGKYNTLRPGYTVSVKIFTDAVEDAVLVPYEAVRQENESEYVFVVRDGLARKTYVETGYELEGYVEIKSGVAKGETVLVSPPDTLKDGDAVEVSEL